MNDHQRAELQKPLDARHIKTREQSGRTLSYVEGWHVIAEANRIFGFDGWTRETLEVRCVNEAGRKVGRAQDDGFGVSYIARVRVTVGGIVRDGTGSGHGIDRDLGLAHESAIKEAETDAMKRALMTFGYPFGLALYDKEQSHVERAAPSTQTRPAATPAPRPQPEPTPPRAQAEAAVAGPILERIYDQKTPYAVVLSDGRKPTFFTESMLSEAKELIGSAVCFTVDTVEKNGRVFYNLKRIWAAASEPELPIADNSNDQELLDDDIPF